MVHFSRDFLERSKTKNGKEKNEKQVGKVGGPNVPTIAAK